MSFQESAAAVVAGTTAIQAIIQKGGLKAAGRLLVIGGAGGVGHVAVQIGKAVGAYVAATTSSADSVSFLTKLGADLVINRNTHDWSQELALPHQQVDVVFDCAGGADIWPRARQVLKPGGIMVTIAGDEPFAPLTVRALLGSVATSLGRTIYSWFSDHKRYLQFFSQADDVSSLNQLRDWLSEGKVKVHVAKTFPMNNVVDMLQAGATQKFTGKLILQVSH